MDHKGTALPSEPTSRRFPWRRVIAVVMGISFLHTQTVVSEPLPITDRYRHNLLGEPMDLAGWHPEFRERCHRLDPEGASDDARWGAILHMLTDNTGIVQPLLRTAIDAQVLFCLEDRADGARGYFDLDYHLLAIRESLPVAQQAAILVHELRHIDQALRGYVPSLDYDFDEMIRQAFALEADVQAVSTLVAWQLRVQGNDTLWQALHDFEHYRDIAVAFEAAMRLTGNTDAAMTAAFRQWYRSPWRVNVYFLNTGMNYLDRLDETKKIQRYATLPPDHFMALCDLPGGGHYACEQTTEIGQSPRALKDRMTETELELYSQWTVPAF